MPTSADTDKHDTQRERQGSTAGHRGRGQTGKRKEFYWEPARAVTPTPLSRLHLQSLTL